MGFETIWLEVDSLRYVKMMGVAVNRPLFLEIRYGVPPGLFDMRWMWLVKAGKRDVAHGNAASVDDAKKAGRAAAVEYLTEEAKEWK